MEASLDHFGFMALAIAAAYHIPKASLTFVAFQLTRQTDELVIMPLPSSSSVSICLRSYRAQSQSNHLSTCLHTQLKAPLPCWMNT